MVAGVYWQLQDKIGWVYSAAPTTFLWLLWSDYCGHLSATHCQLLTEQWRVWCKSKKEMFTFKTKVVPFEMCWFQGWSPIFTLKVKTLSFRFVLHFFKFHYYSMNIKQVFAEKLLFFIQTVDDCGNLLATKAITRRHRLWGCRNS